MRLIALRAFVALVRALLTWGPHCNLASKTTPKTFISLDVVTLTPLITMFRLATSDLENRQISVLVSLTFSPEAFIQARMFVRDVSIEIFSSPVSLLVLITKLSSAKADMSSRSKIGEMNIA